MSNAYDVPLPFETPEEEAERKRREQQALSETIALEEGQTGTRSDLRDIPEAPPSQGIEQTVSETVSPDYLTPQSAAEAAARRVKGSVLKNPEAVHLGGPIDIAKRVPAVITSALDPLGATSYVAGKFYPPAKEAIRGMYEKDPVAETLGSLYLPGKVLKGAYQAFTAPVKFAGPKATTAAVTGGAMLAPSTTKEMEDVKPLPEWAIGAAYPTKFAEPTDFSGQRVTHTVDTAGGPANVTPWELYTLGGIGVASLGAIFAPKIYQAFKFGALPRFRPVMDAAPGTMAMSNLTDLARTYDDIWAGARRLAERAGTPTDVLKMLDLRFGLQTRGGAQAVADSAIMGGRAELPTFSFNTPIPLAQLNKLDNPTYSRYLHLYDTADEINWIVSNATKANKARIAAGPVTVRGMTMPDILTEIKAIEAADPAVRGFAKDYRRFMADVRRFEATGEYSTLSTKTAAKLNTQRPNEVPFAGGQRTDDALYDRGVATATAAEAVRLRMVARMENEAVGSYVDAMRRAQPDTFVRVYTAEQIKNLRSNTPLPSLADNPNWAANTVSFKRRGKTEYYTTDPFLADVLKMDPYYVHGMVHNTIYAGKRMVEIGATGALAPSFAPISGIRNWGLVKLSAPVGMPGAGPLMTLAAIPRQLGPQLAKYVSETLPRITNAINTGLNRGSNGYLAQVFSPNGVQALSKRLATMYESSIFAQLQSAGGHKASLLEQHAKASKQLTDVIDNIKLPRTKALYHGYLNLLSSVHNAAGFAWAAKHFTKMSLPELALTTRRLTGDPRMGGQFYVGGTNKPIRFDDPTRFGGLGIPVHNVGKQAVQTYGALTELGREAYPWFNATQQGLKRVGKAYLDNPVAFTGRAWLYTLMPAAATYLLAYHQDKDPNGQSYVDYMQNRRSDYKKTMNFYVPIPGRPAEDGIEIPRFHEMSFAGRMMESALDHAMRTSIFNEREDALRALHSFVDVAFTPPTLPISSLTLAQQGLTTGMGGPFGGEAYKRQRQPFDQNGGLPINLELTIRAIATGLGEVAGAGAAAFTQTPGSATEAFQNGLIEAGKRMVSKTPIVRDITGILPPSAGSTPTSTELYKKNAVIRDVNRFYKKWGLLPGEVELNPKLQSISGGKLALEAIANLPGGALTIPPTEPGGKPSLQQLPMQRAGRAQPNPTNPLFIEFADKLYGQFGRDAPARPGQTLTDKGEEPGIGFKSLWVYYGKVSEHLRGLQTVNEGSNVSWQKEISERPEQMAFLKKNNIDPMNIRQVRNFYERIRQDVGRVILFTIRKIEDEMSKKHGRPIKMEDLGPYGKPSEDDSEPSSFDSE